MQIKSVFNVMMLSTVLAVACNDSSDQVPAEDASVEGDVASDAASPDASLDGLDDADGLSGDTRLDPDVTDAADTSAAPWDCESLYALSVAHNLGLDSCTVTLGGAGFEDCPGGDTANQCAQRVFRDAETAASTKLEGATPIAPGASGTTNFTGFYLPPCDDLSSGYDLASECGAAAPVRCTDGTRPVVYVDLADTESKHWFFYLGGEGRSCVGVNGPTIDPWTCDKMYFGLDSGTGQKYTVADQRALSSHLPGGINPYFKRGTDSNRTLLGENPDNPFRNINRVWFERCNAYDGDVDQMLDVDGTSVRVFQHGERITRLAIDALIDRLPERFGDDSILVLAGVSDGSSALPFSGPRLATYFKERIASQYGAGATAVKVVVDGLWFPMLAGEAAFNANVTDIGGYDGLASDTDTFLDNYRDNPIAATIPGRTEVYSNAAYTEGGVARLRYEGQGWRPPAFCTSGCYDRDHLMTAWLLDSASAVDSVFLAVDMNDSALSNMSQGGTGQTLWTEVPVTEATWTTPAYEARLRKQALDLAAAINSGLPFGLWAQNFWGHTTASSPMFSGRKMYACDAAQVVQSDKTLGQAMWEWASTSNTFPTIVQGEASASTPAWTWHGNSSCSDAVDAVCEGQAIGTPCGAVDVMCASAPANKMLLCSDPDPLVDPSIACLGLEAGAPCGGAGHTCASNDSPVWLCPTTTTPYLNCNAPGFDPQTEPCDADTEKVCSPSGRCSPPCLFQSDVVGRSTCAAYAGGGDCKICLGCGTSSFPGLCK